MGTPILALVFDRKKKASKTIDGSVELRITWQRQQRYVTTGIRLRTNQWRSGIICNRIDAGELQQTLDEFVRISRKIINDRMQAGELDMTTIVSDIASSQRAASVKHVAGSLSLIDFMKERTMVRKYGIREDTKQRYDRFLRFFCEWDGMRCFEDITEANIIKLDEELNKKHMKPYSKWVNYHRFLNSYIRDAISEGYMRKNPYDRMNIERNQQKDGLSKYLTKEEFRRIETIELPTNYLIHARDLFVFQAYTCLSYTDLSSFDASKIKTVKGRMMYVGRRAKNNQEYMFLIMKPAMEILNRYGGVLPVMSNVKYNLYLKMIAMAAGINKPVSTHWARHTGATMLLNSGANMEVVAKVLGHSSTRITREVYAKLLDETVADEMARIETIL